MPNIQELITRIRYLHSTNPQSVELPLDSIAWDRELFLIEEIERLQTANAATRCDYGCKFECCDSDEDEDEEDDYNADFDEEYEIVDPIIKSLDLSDMNNIIAVMTSLGITKTEKNDKS